MVEVEDVKSIFAIFVKLYKVEIDYEQKIFESYIEDLLKFDKVTKIDKNQFKGNKIITKVYIFIQLN